ncbi:hypothetical protein [Geosporobacter ferrireducens]|nr:hypothetical protein [Geosporobacter ferrireducens]
MWGNAAIRGQERLSGKTAKEQENGIAKTDYAGCCTNTSLLGAC